MLKTIDLFAGAGGLSYGFESTGEFLIVAAAENNKNARGLITLDKRYKIIVSRKLKDTEMDSETKSWFMGYSDHQIILPDRFLPGKDFIEYHNDVIFQR